MPYSGFSLSISSSLYIALSPSTCPSPKRSPPSTTSSTSCSKLMLFHLPSPLLPTLFSGVSILAGESIISGNIAPLAQTVARFSSSPLSVVASKASFIDVSKFAQCTFESGWYGLPLHLKTRSFLSST